MEPKAAQQLRLQQKKTWIRLRNIAVQCTLYTVLQGSCLKITNKASCCKCAFVLKRYKQTICSTACLRRNRIPEASRILQFLCTAVHERRSCSALFSLICFLFLFIGIPSYCTLEMPIKRASKVAGLNAKQ